MKTKDRKDQIELVLVQMEKLIGDPEAGIAWQRLSRELDSMMQAGSRPPRFAGLLRAIWVAATNEQS